MSNNAVEEILSQIPVSQLASELGVDEGTAEQAARAAIPTLIGGLQHNASDLAQEPTIAEALLQHESSSLLDGGTVNLGDVDTADGQKIVHHIFGDQSGQLAQALGSRTGGGNGLMDRLLPILAPIVLAYLAQKIQGGMQSRAGNGGGILNDILGGALGGGRSQYDQSQYRQPQQAPQQQGGGMLGSILGSILSGGGLGGILGGMGEQQQPAGYQQPQQGGFQQRQDDPFTTGRGTSEPDYQGQGGLTNDPGQLRVEDDPTDPNARQQQEQGGGIVDDILGGIFGRRDNR